MWEDKRWAERDKGLRIRGQVEGCEGQEEGCGLSEVMVSSSCPVDHTVLRKLGWEGHDKMNVYSFIRSPHITADGCHENKIHADLSFKFGSQVWQTWQMTEQPCNRTDEERGSALHSPAVRVVHHGDTVTSAGGKLALLNSAWAATTRKPLHGDTVTLGRTWTGLHYSYFNLTGCF